MTSTNITAGKIGLDGKITEAGVKRIVGGEVKEVSGSLALKLPNEIRTEGAVPASLQSINTSSPTVAPKNLDVSSLNIALPSQWSISIVNGKHSDIIDDKGVNIGWISAQDYEKNFDFKQVKPNHSSIIHEESFDIPIGKCNFFTLDVDNGSAASGLVGTHNEYYAVIQIENKVIYIVNLTMNDKKAETKQQFVDLLKKIRLKDSFSYSS